LFNNVLILQDLREWLAKHENALLEIAGSIQLSRNICVALLSLQSWLPFMRRWLRAKMMAFEVEGMSDVGEQIPTMAGDSIFKVVLFPLTLISLLNSM
jgi:hypothetical protein